MLEVLLEGDVLVLVAFSYHQPPDYQLLIEVLSWLQYFDSGAIFHAYLIDVEYVGNEATGNLPRVLSL